MNKHFIFGLGLGYLFTRSGARRNLGGATRSPGAVPWPVVKAHILKIISDNPGISDTAIRPILIEKYKSYPKVEIPPEGLISANTGKMILEAAIGSSGIVKDRGKVTVTQFLTEQARDVESKEWTDIVQEVLASDAPSSTSRLEREYKDIKVVFPKGTFSKHGIPTLYIQSQKGSRIPIQSTKITSGGYVYDGNKPRLVEVASLINDYIKQSPGYKFIKNWDQVVSEIKEIDGVTGNNLKHMPEYQDITILFPPGMPNGKTFSQAGIPPLYTRGGEEAKSAGIKSKLRATRTSRIRDTSVSNYLVELANGVLWTDVLSDAIALVKSGTPTGRQGPGKVGVSRTLKNDPKYKNSIIIFPKGTFKRNKVLPALTKRTKREIDTARISSTISKKGGGMTSITNYIEGLALEMVAKGRTPVP